MRIEFQKLNPKIHFDFISSSGCGGVQIKKPLVINNEEVVIVLNIKEHQLIFTDFNQLLQAKDFFKLKLRPSDRGTLNKLEHYWQIWHNRLPKEVIKGSNKEKIVNAIDNFIRKNKAKT